MYDVIYTDPPWFYNPRPNPATKFGGGAGGHYPLMRDSELLDMAETVRGWTAPNCAMFMWVVMPRLPFALELMEAWGFKYRTNAFTWIKTTKDGAKFRTLPGYYTASNTELVLLGVKGSMPPAVRMTPSVISTPLERHSQKPEEVRLAIERMYPDTNRLEMFARRTAPAWTAWGNEIK